MRALKDGAELNRTMALIGIGALGPEALPAAPAVAAALKDADPDVRGTAAETLGKIGSRGSLPALAAALEDEEAGVRAAASDAIEEIRSLEG